MSSNVGTFDNTISAGNIASLSLGSDLRLSGLVFANTMNDAITITLHGSNVVSAVEFIR